MKEKESIPSFEALVKKASDLQMMPQTARKVIDLVSQESSTAEDLAVVMEKDSGMTTRILKIANSAFYGLRREVKTLQHAIMILGYKSVRSLVVASSSKAVHKNFGITEQLMWDHSVSTAIFSRLISQKKAPRVADVAFVSGLLHNVGKAIMNNECPLAYADVMRMVYNEKRDYHEVELEIFGYTHAAVGGKVIERWGLPSSIARSIEDYALSRLEESSFEALRAEEDLLSSMACVELAVTMARRLGIGYREADPTTDLSSLRGVSVLSWEVSEIEALLAEAAEVYEREKSIFD